MNTTQNYILSLTELFINTHLDLDAHKSFTHSHTHALQMCTHIWLVLNWLDLLHIGRWKNKPVVRFSLLMQKVLSDFSDENQTRLWAGGKF